MILSYFVNDLQSMVLWLPLAYIRPTRTACTSSTLVGNTRFRLKRQTKQTKVVCNGLRWHCATFWIIYSQWCCSSPLHVLDPCKRPVHPLRGLWTIVFVLNDKRKKRMFFAMDWGDPVLLFQQFTVHGIVVDLCMYCTHTNSRYNLPIGG